ncbi:glycerol-3-phosphate dehydrogenase [Lottiidibacillus patelloidae]|uniref:Glycerol-3-phosphate dehydrogenase n=1 Tax=Lottiidibacillus patelloidae TaxID=2670334 RepID=A0A263BRE4_9BACI|nr:glycerol-3-phosphate dehydrogenase/oxidase [Lottiidibacillus patelloidae]OZM55796.1 glycerol-3-phosphate dehydrogenase [Lottiidibacillus patelloidae]
MTFSSEKRQQILQQMSKIQLDVLIIGGGITGSGIALDAVTRGFTAGLVEMQDFSAGTSSRSTKLVHGGLRYLKQFQVKMVAEVGREREIVFENGPHVTTPEWMLLPLYKGGTFGKFSTSIGLLIYDFLARVKKTERRRMLGVQETLEKEPLVKKEGLKGAGYYVEYRTDDSRLTIEVLKEAVTRGAHAVNYSKVIDFIYENGKVIGVEVLDVISESTYQIFAKKIVNATGPWVDTLREKDGSKTGKTLRHTKGSHLVIDSSKFPLKQAVYFDTPDGRMIFAIPREGKTYVGTTDTFYRQDAVSPRITEEDRAYILKAIHYMFPDVQVTEDDIESSWAGVRPLIHEEGKDPSEISRKDEVWESPSGMITIAGGKLTGYRKMAEIVVNMLVKSPEFQTNNKIRKKCKTKKLPISGGDVGGSKNLATFIKAYKDEALALGFTSEQYEELATRYGSNIKKLLTIAESYKNLNSSLDLPLDLYTQLIYSMEYEMTYTPSDFFIRRTGALFFNIQWVVKWKQQVIDVMGNELGWSEVQKQQFTAQLEKELHYAINAEETTFENKKMKYSENT